MRRRTPQDSHRQTSHNEGRVTCPACCGFARADAVQLQDRHRRDPDGMPCKCGADDCPELRNQNIINGYL